MSTRRLIVYKRRYETVAIVNPEAGNDGTDKVLERMRDALGRTEGKEVRFEDWGRRRLAYELRRQKKGHYLYIQYLGSSATVPELERLLGITEEAMKFQTVLLEDRIVESEFDFQAASQDRTGLERGSDKPAVQPVAEVVQEDTSDAEEKEDA